MRLPARRKPFAAEMLDDVFKPRKSSGRSKPLDPPTATGMRYLVLVINSVADEIEKKYPRKDVDYRRVPGLDRLAPRELMEKLTKLNMLGHSRGRWHHYVRQLAAAFIVILQETNPNRAKWFDKNGHLAHFLVAAVAYTTGEKVEAPATVKRLRDFENAKEDWEAIAPAREAFLQWQGAIQG